MDDITRQYIQKIEQINYELTEIVVKQQLSDYLFNMASSYFVRDMDEKAVAIRELANTLSFEAKRDRETFDIIKRKELDEIWNILDEAIPNLNWSK